MTYIVNWEKKGVVVEFYGHVTPARYHAIHDSLYSDHRIDDIRYYIRDMSDVTHLELDEETIFLSTAIDKVAASSVRMKTKDAVISDDEDIRLVLSNLIEESERIGAAQEYKMFRKLEDARQWISSDRYNNK